MATEQRPRPGSLGALLRRVPQRFELVQALMILERERPKVPSLACSNDPQQEVVRLRGPLLPEFSPSQISSLREGPVPHEEGAAAPSRLVLHSPVFGLGGPDGPLPYAYQEWLQQRARLKDRGTAAFLDLFQHRLLSLLYRVHLKYRIALPYQTPEHSPVYQQLLALCGLLPRPMHTLALVPEKVLIARAGLLANGRRSLAGLQSLLTHHLQLPIQLEGFQGGWRQIAKANQTSLGPLGRNRILGRTAICGTRVWDQHLGVRINIGPLTRGAAEPFLPGNAAHLQLAALVSFYFGADLVCTLRLHFSQTGPVVLHKGEPPRLGWSSWLNRQVQPGKFSIDLPLQQHMAP